MPRLFRAPEWDPQFPADRMLPALEATLADLGIDLHAQENVHLDVEQRPKKTPRAFCAPIEVPERVMLVIQPIGGADDWRALFHEAGHTEHFAHTSRRPAGRGAPARRQRRHRGLGDAARAPRPTTPAWLNAPPRRPAAERVRAEGATGLLYFVRRYCAKLLYELEFHAADDPTTMRSRYVEILGDALKIDPSPTDYLGDIDAGFYVTAYLRSWAFEAQLRDYLREEFGNDVVRAARGRLAAARAVVARPAADGGGAARGRDRRDARDGQRSRDARSARRSRA